MPRLLREHFQHMFILVSCFSPICYGIYNAKRDLKFDPVSLTFYFPVEDLTKEMDTWEVKFSYAYFRTISPKGMTQPCKGSINPSSSDFFPKSMTRIFIGISDLYLLTWLVLHCYCSLTCLCLRLSPSGHNSAVWILDWLQKVASVVRVKNPSPPQLKVKSSLSFLLQFGAIETEL